MAKKRQTDSLYFLRLLSLVFAAIFVTTFISGCANEAKNPFGTQSLNGNAPKEESFAIQMDCSGLYNGIYLPETKAVTQLYPMTFTGKWKQLPNNRYDSWYMAMTSEVGARVDLCATMTRCVFDFWDYEFYDNPGKIKLLVDGRDLGTYDLARKDSAGNKILEYVVATPKNIAATASVILVSGRMVLSGVQVNVFNKHWPYE